MSAVSDKSSEFEQEIAKLRERLQRQETESQDAISILKDENRKFIKVGKNPVEVP